MSTRAKAGEVAPATVGDAGRLAYLVSQYPAYSHAFIEREISAMRALGWEIAIFSLRPSGVPGHVHEDETRAVQSESAVSLIRTAAKVFMRHPLALATGIRCALGVAQGRERRMRATIKQLVYLVEAVQVFAWMHAHGLRHIHVHFANNAADVARLATLLGDSCSRERWTWSMAVHGSTDFIKAREYGLTEKAIAADFVTCISEFGRRTLQALVPEEIWDKIFIVRMGIDEPVPLPRGAKPPDKTQSRFRLLYVGRVVEGKGVEVLIEAVRMVARTLEERRTRIPIELRIIGDGPAREVLQSASSMDMPAGVSVQWEGARMQSFVLPAYHQADAFCLPSFAEGMPVVILEALGAGLAVITTPVGGIPELIENGSTGLLVAAGAKDELAAAILRLIDDPALAGVLGEAGYETVKRDYLSSVNARRLACYLKEYASIGPWSN